LDFATEHRIASSMRLFFLWLDVQESAMGQSQGKNERNRILCILDLSSI
jgi:hypothetical protein